MMSQLTSPQVQKHTKEINKKLLLLTVTIKLELCGYQVPQHGKTENSSAISIHTCLETGELQLH